MQIVIEMDDKRYKELLNPYQYNEALCDKLKTIIRKGTPLPKGHGRIIDESKITQATFETIEEDLTSMLHGTIKHRYMVFKGSDAPTIIEAESEVKND